MIYTARLRLRSFQPADWDAVRAFLTDPAVTRWMHFGQYSAAQLHNWFAWCLENERDPAKATWNWAITLAESGAVIGWFGIGAPGRPSIPGERDFGYALDQHFWNQGYMTEALKALLAFEFETLGTRRIFAECEVANIASARVMEKAGMCYEGTFHDTDFEGNQAERRQYGIASPNSLSEPKRIVAQGYDRIADTYADWVLHTRSDERERYTRILFERLQPGARILELGCGPGIPTTAELAQHFRVIGVDMSEQHTVRARTNAPQATIIHADMTLLTFPTASFDAVIAFYSLIHVPREEHAALLRMIAHWLRPGGLLIATMGVHDDSGSVEPDWMGAPMYWSFFDAATNRQLLQDAGLRIENAREETADEDGEPITFLWITAQKPVEEPGTH